MIIGDAKVKISDLSVEPVGCLYPPNNINDIIIATELRKRCMLGDKDACKEYRRACWGED